MKSVKITSIGFVSIVLLFFVPMFPTVNKVLEKFHPLALAIYWVILAIVSIILGIYALRGVER